MAWKKTPTAKNKAMKTWQIKEKVIVTPELSKVTLAVKTDRKPQLAKTEKSVIVELRNNANIWWVFYKAWSKIEVEPKLAAFLRRK